MSSFEGAQQFYLFGLKSGGKKLSYGKTPEDALEILSFRLTEEEMSDVVREDHIKISQRKLQEYVHLLR